MNPRTGDALLVVDLQNDFCEGGALEVAGAAHILPVVNALIADFERAGAPVILTRDWHPSDHSSFASQGGPWPVHCVAGTIGAAFHPALRVPESAWVVSKGVGHEGPGYSPFETPDLAAQLRAMEVRRVLVVGLATDYCVRAAALDAVREGWEVVVVGDAVRGVEAHPGDVARACDELRAAGVRWWTSAEDAGGFQ
ncbi:MAG: isochorismatase family protein [Planctomycetota bacterium]